MKENQLQISFIALYRSSNLSINAIAWRNFVTGFSVRCHEGLQWDSACRTLFARLENRLTDLSIVRVLDVYPRRHPGSIDPRDRGCAPGAGKCRGVHDRDKSTRWSPYRLEEVTGRFWGPTVLVHDWFFSFSFGLWPLPLLAIAPSKERHAYSRIANVRRGRIKRVFEIEKRKKKEKRGRERETADAREIQQRRQQRQVAPFEENLRRDGVKPWLVGPTGRKEVDQVRVRDAFAISASVARCSIILCRWNQPAFFPYTLRDRKKKMYGRWFNDAR